MSQAGESALAASPSSTFPAEDEPALASPFGTRLGAQLRESGECEFRVWAPLRERLDLHLVAPVDQIVPMRRNAAGYHEAVVEACPEGTRYVFRLDGGDDRPDPASRYQPEGVHGPSEVVAATFEWHDRGWKGIEPRDYVIYELHVGTFTEEGTFEAAIARLDHLQKLGVTAVELLPVAQFPGSRNWGYDGAYVGAAQNSYGGPRALKRLVDACHQRGMAILLDVVYNHLGPEGNYLGAFGPYFTDRYKTPWGLALNFDGPGSDDVRWYFIHSALQFVDEFHFDGLRVDAVHAIVDHSAEPFLQDLCEAVRNRGETLGRRIVTIAESDLNDPRVILPKEQSGLGFDAQWADDFHHTLHALLTGEQNGYYSGFPPRAGNLARIVRDGYLYIGQHSAHRGRKYGSRPTTRDGAQFVISAQNHDQVGNRMLGERIMTLAPEKARLSAAATILFPFVPMLFMGEEYGETAPFLYFTSHSDADLIEAVRRGRAAEFEDFAWSGEPPDPHDEETFRCSRLNWSALESEEHASMLRLYRELLAIRKNTPALASLDLDAVELHGDDSTGILVMRRTSGSSHALVAFHFGDQTHALELPFGRSHWHELMNEGATLEGRQLTMQPHSFAVWSGADGGPSA